MRKRGILSPGAAIWVNIRTAVEKFALKEPLVEWDAHQMKQNI